MIETLKNAWKVKELRNKILFTIFIIVIFRIGSVIPVPYIDVRNRNYRTDSENNNNENGKEYLISKFFNLPSIL